MSTHKNRVKMTVTGTPGTGTITLNAASSSYQSFATAYGANATVDILIEEGTAWEVARNCTYTNSGTTVTRGTFEESSTGSAVSFTSAAVVSEILTAGAGQQLALNHVSLADADTTMVVGSMYVGSMSAWATADRTYTLPASANVGDRIGIMVTAGNASYELIIKPDASDTLNGGSAGAEWSRLFMTGEIVIMRCVTANSAWVVEEDGRKFESCRIDTNGTTASHASASSTKISSELATVTANAQNIWNSTNKRLIPRRLGRYLIHGHLQMALMAVSKFCVAQIYKNGATNIGGGGTAANVVASGYPEADVNLFYDVTTIGDYFELFVYNGDSSARNTSSANVYFEATRVGDAL